jgi:hypothetical protein
VNTVGDARIHRDDLQARVLGVAYPSNTLRCPSADLVLLLEVYDLDDRDGGDEDGEAGVDRTVECSACGGRQLLMSKRYQSKAWGFDRRKYERLLKQGFELSI